MELYILPLVVLIILGLGVTMFRVVRRRQDTLKKALLHSGFQRVPDTDLAWRQELAAALFQTDAVVKTSDVYRYRAFDYDLYQFQLVQSRNQSGIQYAMLFKQMDLPPFAVLPNLNLPGFLDGLVKQLLAQVVTKAGFREVEMGGCPMFKKKYGLYAADGQRVRQSVPDETWEALASLTDRVLLQGAGRTLKFQELSTSSNRSGDPTEQLRYIIRQAEHIGDAFRPTLRQVSVN